MAIIFQPIYSYIYYLIFSYYPQYLNVLLTLYFGIVIISIVKLTNNYIAIILIVSVMLQITLVSHSSIRLCV
ncbi:MAG: hypothetical protein HRU34_07800 [Richelia sp.]|nr:hypothetical protein [Richelia sp.]